MAFYQNHIFCCNNERPADHPRGSCKARGADDIRNYLKARVKEEGIASSRVQAAGCMDRCEYGPVLVIYPEGTWYSAKTREDVDDIVAAMKTGTVAERLRLADDQKK